MERTQDADKNLLKKASFWFCGKATAESTVTVLVVVGGQNFTPTNQIS
jgi:hypothetical protein